MPSVYNEGIPYLSYLKKSIPIISLSVLILFHISFIIISSFFCWFFSLIFFAPSIVSISIPISIVSNAAISDINRCFRKCFLLAKVSFFPFHFCDCVKIQIRSILNCELCIAVKWSKMPIGKHESIMHEPFHSYCFEFSSVILVTLYTIPLYHLYYYITIV